MPRDDDRHQEAVRHGIAAVRDEEYLRALNLFTEAYASWSEEKAPEGLSYYGLCIALVDRKFKPAIDLCRKAIELQFYHAEHYLNLARVYIAADTRKKAIEALDEGLRVMPDDEGLKEMRAQMGRRKKPVVPFLDRANPINRELGRMRTTRDEPLPKRDDDDS